MFDVIGRIFTDVIGFCFEAESVDCCEATGRLSSLSGSSQSSDSGFSGDNFKSAEDLGEV